MAHLSEVVSNTLNSPTFQQGVVDTVESTKAYVTDPQFLEKVKGAVSTGASVVSNFIASGGKGDGPGSR